MIAIVNHELRTPLCAAEMAAELLATGVSRLVPLDMEAHGGRAQTPCSLDAGSIFSLFFPIESPIPSDGLNVA